MLEENLIVSAVKLESRLLENRNLFGAMEQLVSSGDCHSPGHGFESR